jgi:hypothetical protein
MSFDQLHWATRPVNTETTYFTLVDDWQFKRTRLLQGLQDLPNLVTAYKERSCHAEPTNPGLTLVDALPDLRLAMACESIAHSLYATTEVAAHFANRVSGGVLPRRFHRICENVQKGKADEDLTNRLGDIGWYRKVREMRTEWTHYSSAFIGERDDRTPIIVIRAWRGRNDRVEFAKTEICAVEEFIAWVLLALQSLDGFGDHLLHKYVLPELRRDHDQEITIPRFDVNGRPLVAEGGGCRGVPSPHWPEREPGGHGSDAAEARAHAKNKSLKATEQSDQRIQELRQKFLEVAALTPRGSSSLTRPAATSGWPATTRGLPAVSALTGAFRAIVATSPLCWARSTSVACRR